MSGNKSQTRLPSKQSHPLALVVLQGCCANKLKHEKRESTSTRFFIVTKFEIEKIKEGIQKKFNVSFELKVSTQRQLDGQCNFFYNEALGLADIFDNKGLKLTV
jgi:hypothetical protein